MTQLYLTPLPDVDARRADKAVASAIEQAGLLEQGGTATENIATENVDLVTEGQIRLGRLVSSKVGSEIDSLSESAYTTLPLYDPSASSLGRARGYYEVENADVQAAKPGVEHVFEYTLTLTIAGTREDARRAVRTNPQAVAGAFPSDATGPVIWIPAAATDVRWYSDANGTEPATQTNSAEAEYGTVAQYDPTDATAAAPALTYDLPFDADGPTDTRVSDTRDRSKFATTAGGDSVNVWPHAYHTGYQFDGTPVIDTGRIRLYLGANPAGSTRDDIAAETYDAGTDAWVAAGLDATNPWTLTDWSLTRIRPARATVRTRWSDGTDEYTLDGIAERGTDGVVWTVPDNEPTPTPTGLTNLLGPTSRAPGELAFAVQGLIDRSTRDA